jgi:hypothetical protein
LQYFKRKVTPEVSVIFSPAAGETGSTIVAFFEAKQEVPVAKHPNEKYPLLA